MASGSSYTKPKPRKPIETRTRTVIPPPATRQLSEVTADEEENEASLFQSRLTNAPQPEPQKIKAPPFKARKVVDEFAPHPLARHRVWLKPIVICMLIGAVTIAVLLSAGIAQRPGEQQLVDFTGGQAYSI